MQHISQPLNAIAVTIIISTTIILVILATFKILAKPCYKLILNTIGICIIITISILGMIKTKLIQKSSIL